MGLQSISEIRRQELKQAAFEVMQKEGVSGTTLEKVAQHAGAGKGIVLHYFKNKQELFEHTMRHANGLLRDEIIRRLRLANSPAERLWAIIDGNFAPAFFTPAICHAWLSLCAEVPGDHQLERVQRVIHGRMRSNLRSALAELAPKADIEPITLGITTLIDGLWLRAGLQANGFGREAALTQMEDYIRHRLGAAVASLRSAPG
jgi:TetR/AcrR family transcriptional regulator, transcriptional repressor of bet genes